MVVFSRQLCRSALLTKTNLTLKPVMHRSTVTSGSGWAKATQWSSDLGKLAILGGSGMGLGALCLYGALQPSSQSIMDQSVAYPPYVRERIRSTYMTFGSGLAITAATAVAAARNPHRLRPVFNMMSSGMGCIGAMALCMGSGIAVQMTPPPAKGQLGLKHALWCGHSVLMGTLIFPAVMMFGPIASQAALYTAGVLGGLSAIAITAPSDKFLYGGGVLGMGFATLFVTNIASMFAPAVAQPFMVNIVAYGGVILFSGFILHYTQGLVNRAKAIPPDSDVAGVRPNFDPVNNAIGLYTHTLNLFMHIAQVLALGGGRRK